MSFLIGVLSNMTNVDLPLLSSGYNSPINDLHKGKYHVSTEEMLDWCVL